ncbi:MAG: aconitate hydratase [Gallionellales bacterium RIFCSPHIGHO2_02_FULL_57_16]|nr:MAG: aconitate hydratase [Gallionellales bacterium RIFCSPHIGHO2_02_FULL_57_16]
MTALNVAQKILLANAAGGLTQLPEQGQPLEIQFTHTLYQDATGTAAALAFEKMGVDRVKTTSVIVVDHKTLQVGYIDGDDHRYLETFSKKYGCWFSRGGNGICHSVFLEDFAVPGKSVIGSDSHTTNAGGMGMLALGAGGTDVSFAMAGTSYKIEMPKVVQVNLTGSLHPGVLAKDVILNVLKVIGIKGNKDICLEYTGPGLKSLNVTDRATICNMGTEAGVAFSIFPSDDITKAYLEGRKRANDFKPLAADVGATYSRTVEIDLSALEPTIALYPRLKSMEPVSKHAGTPIDTVFIGSCTNSNYENLARVGELLRGKKVKVDTAIAPGSQAVARQLAAAGYLEIFYAAGVRVLENACSACIGQGFSPPSNGVMLSTANRNFEGRSGTESAKVHLVSPVTAIAGALTGCITDPRDLFKGDLAFKQVPAVVDMGAYTAPLPPAEAAKVVMRYGPDIAPLPTLDPLPAKLAGEVMLKLGNEITTDHIQPAGKYLSLRSNADEYAKQATFVQVDKTFSTRAAAVRDAGGHGFLIAGDGYGMGSSREHAGLCPRILGVRAIVAKGFERIHLANLANFGILGLIFENPADLDRIQQGAKVSLDTSGMESGQLKLVVDGLGDIPVKLAQGKEDIPMIRAGGALSLFASQMKAV